jgi:hypothetical protein
MLFQGSTANVNSGRERCNKLVLERPELQLSGKDRNDEKRHRVYNDGLNIDVLPFLFA